MRKTIVKKDVDLGEVRELLSQLQIVCINLTFVRFAIAEGMIGDPRLCGEALFLPERNLEQIIEKLDKELYTVEELGNVC